MSNFYNQASWVLVPSGIEEDIVFAQKPISGLGDLSFSRASDATYTDSTGVVRRSPYNLVTFSEMFTDASWVKTSSTITANTISAPNGTLTADTLTASSSFPRVVQNPTIQANQSYRISTYAKVGSASVFTIFVSVNAVTLVNNVQYNLSTGVVTGSGTMQDVGNGWYLCSATFTVGASTASPDIRFFNHAQGITGGWSGSNFFYAWGAQLVEGTSALDYFPTTNRQDVPRIDFRNADGTLSSCGRLLLEPQRTNVYIGSEQLIDLIGVTGVSNNATAPDGNNSADTITEDTSLGRHFTGCPTMNVGSTTVSASVFLKYVDNQYAQLCVLPVGSISFSAIFDLVNGTITATRAEGTATYLSGKIENYGNGWYRCSITGISTQASNFFNIGLSPTATFGTLQFQMQNYTGTGKSMRMWGKQLEAGAYATSYIPTTTAAVTRLADTASKTGVSSLIGQTEGTLFVEANLANFVTNAGILTISDGSNTNIISITTFSSNRIRVLVRTGGSGQFALNSNTYAAGNFKIAVAYKASDFAFYINGVQVALQLSGTVPSCPNIYVGITGDGTTNPLSDRITQAALFQTRLDNATLAQLTTL